MATLFGLPVAIEPGGIAMDMDRVAWTQASDPDAPTDRRQRNVQAGALSSALEHAVPEQMFSTPDEPAEAVSAVKALGIANAEGQRIYRITADNRAAVLPQINHSARTMDEIRSALDAGKVVTTHMDPISVPGWSGAGYIILDPQTGAGAWKISGGYNGAVLVSILSLILFVGAVVPGIALSPAFVFVLTLVIVTLNIVSVLDRLNCGGAGPAVAVTAAFSVLAAVFPATRNVARLLRISLASFIARSGFASGAAAACAVPQQ